MNGATFLLPDMTEAIEALLAERHDWLMAKASGRPLRITFENGQMYWEYADVLTSDEEREDA